MRPSKVRGVSTDSRGDILRLGPAPYLSDRQLEDAVAALCEVVTELGESDRRCRCYRGSTPLVMSCETRSRSWPLAFQPTTCHDL